MLRRKKQSYWLSQKEIDLDAGFDLKDKEQTFDEIMDNHFFESNRE